MILAGVQLFQLAGSDEEMGMQQGRQFKAHVQDTMRIVCELNDMKMAKPTWMPKPVFIALAKRRLSRPLWRDVKQFYPKQASRLESLAKGAQVELRDVLFISSLEMLIGNPHYVTGGCTSMAFDSSQTTTDEVIVARNFDYRAPLAPFQIACSMKPKGRYRSLSFKMAPAPGAIDGMNEHGLTLVYNNAFTTDRIVHHVPLSMVIQEVLETCKTTSEAVDFVRDAKVGGHAALLTIADATGAISVVELTPQHKAVREAKNGMVVNSNHYQIEEMKEYQVPEDAILSGKSLNKGRRVHESSERRLDRAHQMLAASHTIDEIRIAAILRDHRGDSEPSRNTICMHGPIASTMRSTIFYPRRKTIKTLYGNPCENEYEELRLQDWI